MELEPGLIARKVVARVPPLTAARTRAIHRRGQRFYAVFINPGDLCFDIGANVGDRTELFRRLGAEVIAVEPQRNCVETLSRRFADDDGVTVVDQALGRSPGEAEIVISALDSTSSSMSDRWRAEGRFATTGWEGSETVAVTTLDHLISEYGRPRFCKVDVEGYENEVLAGLNSPIRYLSFEFTKEFLEDTVGCISRLERIAPISVTFSLAESMELRGPWREPEDVLVDLAEYPDLDLWGDVYVRMDDPPGGSAAD